MSDFNISFSANIEAMTGFPASSGSVAVTEGTESIKYQELTNQWLNEGVRLIVHTLGQYDPYRFNPKATAEFPPTTGVNVTGKILDVFRAETTTFLDGQVHKCRIIPHSLSYEAKDPDSIHYATPQDPVYFYEPSSSNNTQAQIKVLPVSTLDLAKMIYIDNDNPTNVTYDDKSINNFPDECQELVLLYASKKAAEFLLRQEEDAEVYAPIIGTIQQNYDNLLQAILKGYGVQTAPQQQQAGG